MSIWVPLQQGSTPNPESDGQELVAVMANADELQGTNMADQTPHMLWCRVKTVSDDS